MKNKQNKKVTFACGLTMKNAFALAPMTNTQSYEDGKLSEEEYHWLVKRAQGDFGMVITCASHVQEQGKGFPGQLGIFSDKHINGHQKLCAAIRSYGSLAVLQLHHAGMRSPIELIKQTPVCPSENQETKARALNIEEVVQLKNDFISGALRAKKSGYHGVEIHGAHGYILTQFLSAHINKRTDKYGGSYENRCRLLMEIVSGVREECGKDFLIGVRLSPEKFGIKLSETKALCEQLCREENIDFLDISLWDSFKMPEEEVHNDKTLLEHFTALDYRKTRLTVAGKIRSGRDVSVVLNQSVDFVSIGRSGILHHDFPNKVISNPHFEPISTPVSVSYLQNEGLADSFIKYLSKWQGFVDNNI